MRGMTTIRTMVFVAAALVVAPAWAHDEQTTHAPNAVETQINNDRMQAVNDRYPAAAEITGDVGDMGTSADMAAARAQLEQVMKEMTPAQSKKSAPHSMSDVTKRMKKSSEFRNGGVGSTDGGSGRQPGGGVQPGGGNYEWDGPKRFNSDLPRRVFGDPGRRTVGQKMGSQRQGAVQAVQGQVMANRPAGDDDGMPSRNFSDPDGRQTLQARRVEFDKRWNSVSQSEQDTFCGKAQQRCSGGTGNEKFACTVAMEKCKANIGNGQ